MKKKEVGIIVIGILFIQIIDFIFFKNLSVGEEIILLPFFKIKLVLNSGVAFSFLANQFLLIIALSLVLLYFIYKYKIMVYHIPIINNGIILIMIGASSNLIERVIHNYVIDYFQFNLYTHNFAIFNVADVLIVIGVSLIIIGEIYGNKSRSK